MRQGFEQVDKRFDEMLKRRGRQFLWVIGFIATSRWRRAWLMRPLGHGRDTDPPAARSRPSGHAPRKSRALH
ncbi:hypothetical protein CKO31_16845 [Thiohalocapsa halophila]|uniref:Transposase n=1 Tax=Thiohalocapsa halophila TaxID=69359 RepID=A0ABS1CKB3_9GAMM|nr:hypothetical protein [Thiohalocapsa halophila]